MRSPTMAVSTRASTVPPMAIRNRSRNRSALAAWIDAVEVAVTRARTGSSSLASTGEAARRRSLVVAVASASPERARTPRARTSVDGGRAPNDGEDLRPRREGGALVARLGVGPDGEAGLEEGVVELGGHDEDGHVRPPTVDVRHGDGRRRQAVGEGAGRHHRLRRPRRCRAAWSDDVVGLEAGEHLRRRQRRRSGRRRRGGGGRTGRRAAPARPAGRSRRNTSLTSVPSASVTVVWSCASVAAPGVVASRPMAGAAAALPVRARAPSEALPSAVAAAPLARDASVSARAARRPTASSSTLSARTADRPTETATTTTRRMAEALMAMRVGMERRAARKIPAPSPAAPTRRSQSEATSASSASRASAATRLAMPRAKLSRPSADTGPVHRRDGQEGDADQAHGGEARRRGRRRRARRPGRRHPRRRARTRPRPVHASGSCPRGGHLGRAGASARHRRRGRRRSRRRTGAGRRRRSSGASVRPPPPVDRSEHATTRHRHG